MVAVLSDSHPYALRRSDLVAAARMRGGAPERLHPSVYRRRRLLAAGLLLLLIAAVLMAAQSTLAGTGGGPLTTTGAAAVGTGPMTPADAAIWVVRPGDTLWSIARSLDPNGDVRPLVDRLSSEVHGGDIYPGETIAIPSGTGSR